MLNPSGVAGSDCERVAGWMVGAAGQRRFESRVHGGRPLVGLAVPGRPAPIGERCCRRCSLLAVGVGSFAYHGPQPGWAAIAHDGSVAGWSSSVRRHRPSVDWLGGPRGRSIGAVRAAAAWLLPALVVYTAGTTGAWLCHPDALLAAPRRLAPVERGVSLEPPRCSAAGSAHFEDAFHAGGAVAGQGAVDPVAALAQRPGCGGRLRRARPRAAAPVCRRSAGRGSPCPRCAGRRGHRRRRPRSGTG